MWHSGTHGYVDTGGVNGGDLILRSEGSTGAWIDEASKDFHIAQNLVIDTNNHGLFGRNSGGTLEQLLLLDASNVLQINGGAVTGGVNVTGTIQLDGVNASGNVQVGEGLYMKERSTGDSDIATYGQLYTKNSTQQELYFVTEDGVEHHVAGGSISETFGVVKNSTETLTSSTTLQNDDDLAISVVSGEVYHWTCLLILSRLLDATNCGFKWDFSVPASSTGTYQWTLLARLVRHFLLPQTRR
jgi:hypothetical protein